MNQAGLENAQENRRNGRVNVRILQATAMIADETAKDSSAMITYVVCFLSWYWVGVLVLVLVLFCLVLL